MLVVYLMRVKISCDSTSDLSVELVEKYDIGVIPLVIIMGSESLRDGVEVTPGDIFDYVESGRGTCATGAVNVEEYAQYFREYLKEYDAVVHINISSEFSACHQNATIAAREMENVYIVDSMNLSTGSGNLVLDGAILASGGMSAREIRDELVRRASLVEASFVIDTLKYLRRGGRCSALTALGANVLKLKPCIEVKDGKMDVGKKYRGSLKKCVANYVRDRLNGRNDIDRCRVFITYTPILRDILEDVTRVVEETGCFNEIIYTEAGCTISNHCGPGTLGLMFYRKEQ